MDALPADDELTPVPADEELTPETPASAPDAELQPAPADEALTPVPAEAPAAAPAQVAEWQGPTQPPGQSDEEKDALLREVFKDSLERDPDTHSQVIKVARGLGLKPEVVEKNLPAFKATWEEVNHDPAKWRKDNPELAAIVLEHPELGTLVHKDPQLSVLSKALEKFGDFFAWVTDPEGPTLWDSAPPTEAELATRERALADFKVTRQQQMLVRDGKVQAMEGLDAVSKPVIRTVARYQETAAQMKVAQLYHQLMSQRGANERAAAERAVGMPEGFLPVEQDTYELEKRIVEAEQAAVTRDYGEGPVGQLATDVASAVASQVAIAEPALKGAGIGGAVLGTLGAAAGAIATRSVKGALFGAKEGFKLGAKWGGKAGLALGSYELESGGAYQELLRRKRDDGQPLTEQEARGGAMIYGGFAAIVELWSTEQLLKTMGPAGEKLVGPAGKAALAELLSGDVAVREIAKRVAQTAGKDGANAAAMEGAKELVAYVSKRGIAKKVAVATLKGAASEGLEEGVQQAGQDLISYGTASKSQWQWQTLPTLGDALADTFMSAEKGAIGGLGMAAPGTLIHMTSRVMEQSQALRNGALVKSLAAVAKDSPTVAAAPDAVARLVEAHTAKHGEPITHLYVDPHAFSKLFQDSNADPAEAASQLMGAEGPRQLQEAMAKGTRLEIPVADYLSKWGATEAAAQLADDTATTPLGPTNREAVAMDAEIAARSKQLVAKYEKEEATAPKEAEEKTFVDTLEEQLLGAQKMKPEAAQKRVAIWRAFIRTQSEVFKLSAAELFRHYTVVVKKGVESTTAPSPYSSRQRLEQRAETLSDKERAVESFQDANTGILNDRGFDALPVDPARPLVAHLSVEGIKWLNEGTSHDRADLLYRAVAKTLHEIDPNAAKVGGDFALRVADQAELDQVLSMVNERMPVKGFTVSGAVGDTFKEAGKAHGALKAQAEAAGTRAKRGARPLGLQLEAKDVVLPEDRVEAEVPAVLAEQVSKKKLPPDAYFQKRYRNQDTGAWTAEGWKALPRKRHTIAFDLKGLKDVNATHGELKGDEMIAAFSAVAVLSGGEFGDFAHLHGDEYAAQFDDEASAKRFVSRLQAEVAAHPVEYWDAEKEAHVPLPVQFRFGLGRWTYESADKNLNERKKLEPKQRDTSLDFGDEAAPASPVDVERSGRAGQVGPVGEAQGGDPNGPGAEGGPGGRGGPGGPADAGRGGLRASPAGAGEDAGVGLPEHEARAQLAAEDAALAVANDAARAWVARMKDKEKQAQAAAWLLYALDPKRERPERPPTPLLNEMAAKFGIVDPLYGFTADEAGRSLERKLGGRKAFGKEPAELRRQRLEAIQFKVTGDMRGRLEQPALSPAAPVWHSAVERAAAAAKQKAGDAKSWLAVLSKTPGVKKEELELLGLPEWLAEQKGAISREQVVAFIQANKIDVKERLLEAGGGVSEDTKAAVSDAFDAGEAWIKADYPGRERDMGLFNARSARDAIRDGNHSRAMRFAEEAIGAGDEEGMAADIWGPLFEAIADSARTGTTQYGGYTTQGAKEGSYKELLLYAPGAEGFTSGHFGGAGKGLTAHVRFSEHVTKSVVGKAPERVLMVEEIQSDLHQQGREKGYKSKAATKAQQRLSAAEKAFIDHLVGLDFSKNKAQDEALQYAQDPKRLEELEGEKRNKKLLPLARELRAAYVARAELAPESGVIPDAPFKDTWEAMAVRRLVRWAADKGFKKLAWTTGETQADRYSLSSHVETLLYYPDAQLLLAIDKDGETKHMKLPPEELPGAVGREVAAKLLATPLPEGTSKAGREELHARLSEIDAQMLATMHERGGYTPPGQSRSRPIERIRRSGPEGVLLEWREPGDTEWTSISPDRTDVLRTLYPENEALQSEAAAISAEIRRSEDADHERQGRHSGSEEGPAHELGGLDLKLGGEGMKAAYDQRIPSIVKKLGGKVQQEKLGTGHTVWTAELPEELLNKARAEGMPLFAGDPKGPRGYMEMAQAGAQRLFTIGLNKSADLSTFLHESGHVFLELFGELAQREDAPERVTKDYASLLKWLDVGDDGIKREHHEKFARAFEAYLMEGKAPSRGLEASFERFKLWMKQVYRSLLSLDVELSDEVRGVFDRLLASDAEIAKAQTEMGVGEQLFRSPEEAGMNPEQWKAYLEARLKATSSAQRQLELSALKDKLRENEAWWKEAQAEEKKAALEEYDSLPASKAFALLRTGDFVLLEGEKPERGPALKLDPARVAYALGRQPSEKLNGVMKQGGMEPDVVADLLGFPTARAMLEAMEKHPERAEWAAERAAEKMQEKYPDVLKDKEKLAEATSKGLHGDLTAGWLIKEWEALVAKAKFDPETGRSFTVGGKKQNQVSGFTEGLPPVEAFQRAARIIAEKSTVRKLDAGGALRAERAAAENAAKAAARGNWEQALAYKQQQLLNFFLNRELTKARELRDRFVELAGQLANDKARAKLGKVQNANGVAVYRDGVDLILEALQLKDPEENRARPLSSLNDVIKSMEDAGATILFDPEVVERLIANPSDYRNMTMDELREVDAAVRNIKATATIVSTAMVDGKRVAQQEVVAQLLKEAAENLPHLGAFTPTESSATAMEKTGGYVSAFDAMLLKPEVMALWLGAKDLKSMWFRAVVLPLQQGKHREADLLNKTVQPILHAFEKMPKEVQARMTEKVDGAALFPTHREAFGRDLLPPRERFEILMMALNAGNASNLQRLTEGRNITEQQVSKAISMLTKEEMDWVQTVWDACESLWPEASALEERDSGLAPPKIQARPVETPHGTYRGGYFPAIYDRRVDRAGEVRVASEAAHLMDPSYTRGTTAKGHLKSRVDKYAGAISLEPGNIPAHLAQVVHDIAFREAVRSVGGLILNPDVQAALKARLGDARAGVFLQWVKDIGAMRGLEGSQHVKPLLKIIRALRGNTVIAALGFSVPNMIEDLSNIPAAIPRTDLKAQHLAAALAEFGKGVISSSKWAHEKSGELRSRREQLHRELHAQVEKMTAKGLLSRGPMRWMKKHAFVLMETSDWATSTPIWMGAYRQAIGEGLAEPDAVIKADATIREVFSSHSPVDKAGILRDKGYVGATLMFYGFLNGTYNGLRDIFHELHTAEDGKTLASRLPRVTGRALGLIIATTALSEWLRGRGREPDETWSTWFLRKSIFGALATTPFGGDIGNVVEGRIMGKQVNPHNNSMVGVAGAVFDSASRLVDELVNDGDQLDKRLVAFIRSLGPVAGVPGTSQAVKTGAYVKDLLSGDRPPQHPGYVISGGIYGEKDNQPATPFRGADDQ